MGDRGFAVCRVPLVLLMACSGNGDDTGDATTATEVAPPTGEAGATGADRRSRGGAADTRGPDDGGGRRRRARDHRTARRWRDGRRRGDRRSRPAGRQRGPLDRLHRHLGRRGPRCHGRDGAGAGCPRRPGRARIRAGHRHRSRAAHRPDRQGAPGALRRSAHAAGRARRRHREDGHRRRRHRASRRPGEPDPHRGGERRAVADVPGGCGEHRGGCRPRGTAPPARRPSWRCSAASSARCRIRSAWRRSC